MKTRDEKLISIVNKWGYNIVPCRAWNGFLLRQSPVAGYPGTIIQHVFRSVQSAVDWLIPIIHNPEFTDAVTQENYEPD